MRYCKRCINVDTRPDIEFDEEGICPACRFAEQNKEQGVNWDQRRKELAEIVAWGKANSKCSYDCIVTVSGGKDSMRQAFYARDELGLKVLLVNSAYPPEQLHERGAYNLANLVAHGFDTISVSLNPQIWKRMMQLGFLKYGNQAKSTELPLYAIPIHVAIAYKIPLIFLGENPLYTIGQQEGKAVGGDATGMKYSHTLQGGTPDKLLTKGMIPKDVYFFCYPSDDEIEYAKLRVVYLGYYIEDWSLLKNAQNGIKNGLKIRDEHPNEIGDYFGVSALDEEFKIVNQMIKYIKFGYGAVTDQICIAFNQGMMDRATAFECIKRFDGKCHSRYIKQFCKYMDISEEKFWQVVETYRGKHVWEKDKNGEWKLKAEFPTYPPLSEKEILKVREKTRGING